MRGPLLSLICAFALLFSACSKEESAAPKGEKLYSVAFRITSLSHDMVPMASVKPTGPMFGATTSGKKLADVINYLHYMVYDEEGSLLVDKVTQNTESDFGQINDALAKGKYKILIFGRRHRVWDNPWLYNKESKFYSYGLIDDVFFKEFDLVVSEADNEHDVVLRRKVGRVEIELVGKIPPTIGEIKYSISGVSEYFIPQTNRGDNSKNQTRSLYFYSNGSPYTRDSGELLNFYFFLDEDKPAKAIIRMAVFDHNQNIIALKVIENVPVAINKTTKLRGRLFEDTGNVTGQSFSISF